MQKIIDNKKIKVIDAIKEELKPDAKVSVISSLFTIYAYDALKSLLGTIKDFRFLFVEPTFVKNIEDRREFELSKRGETQISGTPYEIRLRNELTQSSTAKECAQWIRDKATFRSLVRPDASTTKMIHAENPSEVFMIHGPDFTAPGLGVVPNNRFEAHVYSTDKEVCDQAREWFDDVWNSNDMTTEVTSEVLESLETVYKENTPEFLYHVSLYNLFKEYLDDLNDDNALKVRTGFKESVVWNKLYDFQKDGVVGAIQKIEEHGGCILADSVGLGKTFEALAVIKYYQLRNHRVLVLCPKKLRDNWSMYRSNDVRNILAGDRFSYDILNHTDLSREKGMSGDLRLDTLNWSNYDLVVIDESHNFRNNNPRKDKLTRYQKLMQDIIKSGVKTKVMMLSATPVNNRMRDLKNQISILTEGDDHALSRYGVKNIQDTLRIAQETFNNWQKQPAKERTTNAFLEMLGNDYFRLLDLLTIARSRKHVEKYYDMTEIGKFPERLSPISRKPDIDTHYEFPSMKEINKTLTRLKLAIFSPLSYVYPEKYAKYAEMYDIEVQEGASTFKQTDREKNLVNLMRVNILKRLESSIHAYRLTTGKIKYRIDELLKTIEDFENNTSGTNNSYSVDGEDMDESLDGDDPEIESATIGEKIQVDLNDVDLVRWKQDLIQDLEILNDLLDSAHPISPDRDNKLIELQQVILDKQKNNINPGNNRVLIFSAFADTAEYLYDNLAPLLKEQGLNVALVTGSRKNQTTADGVRGDFNEILTHFSPTSKERDKVYPNSTANIDVLIGTDCISEGQNLQDCDCLVNYDIHWNPVRIIQRFGRIDRIGSINEKIQLINFWPNMELEEYINLEGRVRGRMVLLNVSATGEEDMINMAGEKEMNDMEYRKQQLQRLQDEVVDLEDISGGISITDFTMQDFKMDLIRYMEGHRSDLEKAPQGMYAVTNQIQNAKPGVIYILRQAGFSKEHSSKSNALHPFYLVYISDDGEIKYSYTNAKQILDTMKSTCLGKDQVVKDLVKMFDKETNQARDMSTYSGLLHQCVMHIIGEKKDNTIRSMFTAGKTSIAADANLRGVDDFELVSFLVLK